MSATRGPVPERSDQVVRRNVGEPVTKIKIDGEVDIPALDLDGMGLAVHPLVESLYRSMSESAQARYYEPSDWEYARLTMFELNRMLWSTKPSAMYLTAVNQMLTSLLLTEGDRRRVRIEVERTTQPPGQVVSLETAFQNRLQQRSS